MLPIFKQDTAVLATISVDGFYLRLLSKQHITALYYRFSHLSKRSIIKNRIYPSYGINRWILK